MEILVLGNEFIKEDSLAKEIGKELEKEGFKIIFIKDSFQLMEKLNSGNKFIVLDVVKNIEEVKIIGIDELKDSKILSSHDFDAGFVLKLLSDVKNIKIIGIPFDLNIINSKDIVKTLIFENMG